MVTCRGLLRNATRANSVARRCGSWSAVHLDTDGNPLAYGVVLNNGSTTPIFDVVLDAQDLLGKLRTLKLPLQEAAQGL
ncbi:hypothetical protein [Arthrobacter sp.]|uniref:hypothetical protein n=1 Tax=Arthrobacter sp. TaxID=1667 RepID=UPI002810A8D2|nr:hypothetical protein [Arthrobacter sp.]